MSWELVEEAMDHAPRILTSPERFLLAIIAEYAQDPKTRECEKSTEDLAHRMGTSPDGVRKTLGKLKEKGVDVRVPIGVDRRGAPVYANRGRVPRYRLPKFSPPEGCPCYQCNRPSEGGTSVPPSGPEGVPSVPPFSPEGGTSGVEGGTDGPERRDKRPSPPVAGNPVAAALAARLNLDQTDALRLIAEVVRLRAPENLGAYLRAVPDTDLRAVLASTRPTPTTNAPETARLPPPCGQCDARPNDMPSARIEWLDVERTQSRPCPRCHPGRREESPDAA